MLKAQCHEMIIYMPTASFFLLSLLFIIYFKGTVNAEKKSACVIFFHTKKMVLQTSFHFLMLRLKVAIFFFLILLQNVYKLVPIHKHNIFINLDYPLIQYLIILFNLKVF